MSRLALLLVAAALTGVPAAAAAGPVLVTPDGVAGVTLGMTLTQVKQRLGVSFVGARSGNELDGAICGSRAQGEASFQVRSGVPHLDGITFTGGVRTHEGIAPGSTLRELRQAYGRRLTLDNDPDSHTGDTDVVRSSRSGTYDLVFMVDEGRVVAIGFSGGVLDVHCPTVSTPPPATIGVLSLAGASGLLPVMPENEVIATWPWFPTITETGGSGYVSWMPICAGATQGVVDFGGGALLHVWLNSGASTDVGISIGSTLDDLNKAYGADLQEPLSGRATYVVHAPGPPPVATLGFRVSNGMVTEIGFGGAQGIGAYSESVWC